MSEITGETKIFEIIQLKGETGAIIVDYFFFTRGNMGVNTMFELKSAAQLTGQSLETILKAFNDLPDKPSVPTK